MRFQRFTRLIITSRFHTKGGRRTCAQFTDGHQTRFLWRTRLSLPGCGQKGHYLLTPLLCRFVEMFRNVFFLHPHLPRTPERQLPLHRRPVFHGGVECFQDLRREFHPTLPLHLHSSWFLKEREFSTQFGCFREPCLFLFAISGQLSTRSHRDLILKHDSCEERLKLIKIGLQ